MISKNWMRYALGIILGGCAGLSITATILPLVLAAAGLKEEFLVRWDLGGYAAHCVLAFAFGGWLVARVGVAWTGPLILGGVGVACGGILAFTVYPGEMEWLLWMVFTAGAYGTVGGLLLGHLLKKPPEMDAES